MGIYGMGKAFNLQYAQRSVQPQRGFGVRMPQQQFGVFQPYQQTTSITVQNGPRGFWGFMSGLVSGLGFGGFGGIGGSFFNSGIGTPAQNNTMNNQLANLEKLGGSKWTIVAEGNGRFTITDGKGNSLQNATYKDAQTMILNGTNTKTETQGNDDKVDGDKGDGDKVDGDKGDGDKVDGDKVDGNKGDGDKVDGNKGDGDKVDGDKGDGKKAGGADGWIIPNGSDVVANKDIVVHDTSGATKDIKGKTKISDEKTSEGYPKTITVSNRTYTFKEIRSDGSAIYTINGGHEYRLEQKADGSFGLNQYSEDKGYGVSDSTKLSS